MKINKIKILIKKKFYFINFKVELNITLLVILLLKILLKIDK
jgi:hypothetical protein